MKMAERFTKGCIIFILIISAFVSISTNSSVINISIVKDVLAGAVICNPTDSAGLEPPQRTYRSGSIRKYVLKQSSGPPLIAGGTQKTFILLCFNCIAIPVLTGAYVLKFILLYIHRNDGKKRNKMYNLFNNNFRGDII